MRLFPRRLSILPSRETRLTRSQNTSRRILNRSCGSTTLARLDDCDASPRRRRRPRESYFRFFVREKLKKEKKQKRRERAAPPVDRAFACPHPQDRFVSRYSLVTTRYASSPIRTLKKSSQPSRARVLWLSRTLSIVLAQCRLDHSQNTQLQILNRGLSLDAGRRPRPLWPRRLRRRVLCRSRKRGSPLGVAADRREAAGDLAQRSEKRNKKKDAPDSRGGRGLTGAICVS